jgi:ribose 5-phosphate isomerase B
MSSNLVKIAMGADHAGFDCKELIKAILTDFEIHDFGTYSAASVDYPDFAHPVAEVVEKGSCDFGILVCGSGNGIAIAANKHQGIRAAICWENELASLSRMHNNANIICIPARFVTAELAKQMVMTFLNTAFEGGRHEKRVEKISC